ncbi:HXXEE domain-containing protein [Nocardiopsis sediminis]|uniref:HXXEE domain-containing protein n=1 Tax=Nocardiopsis sediminis TaxID=1778267 RepID=A0ABV8FTD0_9ACTN
MPNHPAPRTSAAPGTAPLPAAATWGLLAAWALHDAEELITMPGWARRARPRLEAAFPAVPGGVWDRLDVSRTHAATAIGLMGVVMAAAAADGARTGGRSPFYQAALAGFGLHTVTHLAQSALTRGYTPGVVTAPVIAAPFSLWAWGRLRRAGVPTAAPGTGSLLLMPVALGSAHGLASAVERIRARRGRTAARRR